MQLLSPLLYFPQYFSQYFPPHYSRPNNHVPAASDLSFYDAGAGIFLNLQSTPAFHGPYLKNTNLTAIARPACAATIPIKSNRLVCASALLSTGYRFLTRNRTDQANPTETETHCMTLIIVEREKIWITATRRD
jgi:hypothetical protein